MNNIAHFNPWLGAAILTLAACGGGGTNSANAANDTAANEAAVSNQATVPANATAAAPAASAPAGALTAEFMVGKWSAFDGDCSHTIELKKDGTATTPIGTAKWTVTGDTLTFDYQDGSKPTTSAVKPVGANEIEFTHESGTKEIEKRC